MATSDEVKQGCDANFEWNVETELHLFEAMSGHKPVGISKYFHMICICDKLESLLGKPVPSDVVWAHLMTMYDMSALDENESIPFPNNEEDFTLPDAEYSELMAEKVLESNSSETEHPSSVMKGVRDYTRVGRGGGDGVVAPEEKEESFGGRGRGKGRGKRGPKPRDRRLDKESSPATSTSSKKTDEETAPATSSAKKGKLSGSGKRSLRSRADDKDDAASNKSITPPPAKRPRRI